MKTLFLEEEDSFSRPGRFLPGLEDFFPGIGRFLSLEWKDSLLGLEDSFAGNERFLRRDWTIPFPGLADSFPGTGKFHVAEKEFPSLTEAEGVSHSRLKFTASFLSYLFFYWLSHFYFMKNPPKFSQAVLSTLSADPKPSFKHKMYDLCIFLEKRRLAHYKPSSPEWED